MAPPGPDHTSSEQVVESSSLLIRHPSPGGDQSHPRRMSRQRFVGCIGAGLLATVGYGGWLYAREPNVPWFVTGGDDNVRLSYAYAVAHPEVLRYIPCYCGCGESSGHTSVLDCFVAGRDLFDRPRYNDHGVSCHLCLAVVRTTMDKMAAGKTVAQTRAEVDTFYSPYALYATHTRRPFDD